MTEERKKKYVDSIFPPRGYQGPEKRRVRKIQPLKTGPQVFISASTPTSAFHYTFNRLVRFFLVSKISLVLVLSSFVIPLAAFEAHVINVTATIERRSQCPNDQITYISATGNPAVSAVQKFTINPDDTITILTTLAKTFVDNTFGANSIGWKKAHNFKSLVSSDNLQLGLFDNAGTKRMEFKIDYISQTTNVSSGYETLCASGGDGSMILGSASDIVSCRTSLGENFNTFGYVLTTDSPATDMSYTPNQNFPNWIFDVWYEVTVKGSVFDPFRFGRPKLEGIHASPSKTGNDSEEVVEGDCPAPPPPPPLCDSRSAGYWSGHEGCSHGEGSSIWASELNILSNSLSSVFAAYTGEQVCLNLADCPGGDSFENKLCKAKKSALANELNVVSNHQNLNALLAGADDGSPAFDHLDLSLTSTVRQALTTIEEILANSSSTVAHLMDAEKVADRIYTFYEEENAVAPYCVMTPESGQSSSGAGPNSSLLPASVIENLEVSGGNSGETAELLSGDGLPVVEPVELITSSTSTEPLATSTESVEATSSELTIEPTASSTETSLTGTDEPTPALTPPPETQPEATSLTPSDNSPPSPLPAEPPPPPEENSPPPEPAPEPPTE